jgi:hypothetical protein
MRVSQLQGFELTRSQGILQLHFQFKKVSIHHMSAIECCNWLIDRRFTTESRPLTSLGIMASPGVHNQQRTSHVSVLCAWIYDENTPGWQRIWEFMGAFGFWFRSTGTAGHMSTSWDDEGFHWNSWHQSYWTTESNKYIYCLSRVCRWGCSQWRGVLGRVPTNQLLLHTTMG